MRPVPATARPLLRAARTVLGVLALVWAVAYLARAVRGADLGTVAGALGR